MKPTRCTLLLSLFISPLYKFRATMCPSSGELTVFMRYWYFSFCMGGCLVCRPDQTATHTEWKILVSHGYSKFSWWWAHSCPKHVQRWNKLRSSVHLIGIIWQRLIRWSVNSMNPKRSRGSLNSCTALAFASRCRGHRRKNKSFRIASFSVSI